MNNQLLNDLKSKLGTEKVSENEPLAIHTTFKIGGPAKIYIQVNTVEELKFSIEKANHYNTSYFLLGGGTNLLVSDKGFKGLVIKNNINKISIKSYSGSLSRKKMKKLTVEIAVTSGVLMNQLVRFSIEENLTGLEVFLGQPGTVGGAVNMNAHNMQMGEFFGEKIYSAKILSKKGEIKEVDKSYFQFSYDKSILQKTKDIVLSVTLKLERGNHDDIWEKANQAMEHRKKTQPFGVGSSGCTFRNISKADAIRIGTPNGTTSAGYLIEAVGLKNYPVGGAKFSEKHANFIVNTGGATASHVDSLIRLAKTKVEERFGIDLREEIVRVGY